MFISNNAKYINVRNVIVIIISIIMNGFVPGPIAVSAYTLADSPGSLDSTFDTDGKVITDFNNNGGFGQNILTQPDGKIIVIGSSYVGENDLDFALARYNNDGSLDTTFEADGKVTTGFISSFGNNSDSAKAGAYQSWDGKIVVVGSTEDRLGYSFAMARYNTDGSLDTSFGTDGRVIADGGNDLAQSVVIQDDGKLIAAGVKTGSVSYFALARFNEDGLPDTTFGTGGKVITDFNGQNVSGGYIVLQPNGKMLLAGSRSTYQGEDDFAMARYNSDGALDMTFGGGGKVITNILGEDDYGNAIAIQPDGKIIMAGSSYDGGISYVVLARYNGNGSLDTTFDADGKAISTFNGFGNAVGIQSNGKIIVGGYYWAGADGGDYFIERYNPNGQWIQTLTVMEERPQTSEAMIRHFLLPSSKTEKFL